VTCDWIDWIQRHAPTLVCPLCRRAERGGRAFPLQVSDGKLRCVNPRCSEEYPTHPFLAVLPDLASAARFGAFPSWLEVPCASGLLWLRSLQADSAILSAARRIAMYAETDYADILEPDALHAPAEPPLSIRLAALVEQRKGAALVCGAGAGRLPLELARFGFETVVALDLDPVFVSWLSLVCDTQTLPPVAMPTDAVRWQIVEPKNDARFPEAGRVLPLCADATDPPWNDGTFDLVALPNLIDNVPNPAVVLRRAVELVAPGGTLLVVTPFDWQSGLTPPAARLELRMPRGADAAQVLVDLLENSAAGEHLPRMRLESRCQMPWSLRAHSRHRHLYQVEVLLFRRLLPEESRRAESQCR
jgi:SAM-dependent methyltransferase